MSVLVAMLVVFSLSVARFHAFLLQFWYSSELLSIFLLQATCKFMSIGTRVMIVGDQTVPIRTISMFAFMLNTFTSLTAKRFVLDVSGGDILNFAYNSMLMAFGELVVRSIASVSFTLITGKNVQKEVLNTLTLDEILNVGVHLERCIYTTTSIFFVDTLAEIYVCFLIFFQESCMPVWNQYRIYMQEDSYDTRVQTAAVVLAVQLGCELCVDLPIWNLNRYLINSPCSYSTVTKFEVSLECTLKYLGGAKCALVFGLGVMMYHQVAFWPKCHSCLYPYSCLLLTQCFRDGSVMINGEDACTKYPTNVTNLDRALLEWRRNVTAENLTTTDLGCQRKSKAYNATDVDCVLGVGDDIWANNFDDL